MLFQCFAGAEVEHGGLLAHPHDVAGLMTRMRADEDGFAFTYVLPFTRTTALVEFTRFSRRALSPLQLAQECDAELRALGLGLSDVVRVEHGVLPMGLHRNPAAVPPGVVMAGNGGGAIRPSTGYAFMRIQRWSQNCAERMGRGAAPVGHPRDGAVQRQLDRIFLQVLRETPSRTPEFLMALASRVAPERLLHFLTDCATPLDMAALVASLPVLPFLQQLPASGVDVAAAFTQGGAVRSHPVHPARLCMSAPAHAR